MNLLETEPTETETSTPFKMRGELKLRFERNPDGKTLLRERFRRGLFHLSKAYSDGTRSIIQVVNPTAGLFEHDSISANIEVGSGAEACVFSPSSTQVHSMTGSGEASSEVNISVETGGTLVYYPRWTVLRRGARFSQKTSVHLGEGVHALLFEPLSAGRIAHGEFLEFERLDSRLEIFYQGLQTVRERFCCGARLRPWIWKKRGRDFGYICSVYLICPDAGAVLPTVQKTFSKFQSDAPGIDFSVTVLHQNILSMRLLADSASSIQSLLRVLFDLNPDPLRIPLTFQRLI